MDGCSRELTNHILIFFIHNVPTFLDVNETLTQNGWTATNAQAVFQVQLVCIDNDT